LPLGSVALGLGFWNATFEQRVIFQPVHHVTSFFDVFTELSLDGGTTWTPQPDALHFELGPNRNVPEAGSTFWMLLTPFGALVLRRQARGKSATA